tara:strand:+ start:82 stop:984 length:903 start_codon:yes stop_codon:yes gene_type:complete
MKNSIYTLIAAALSILPLNAEDEPAKAKQKGPRDGAPSFLQLDKDGDKAISKEEAGERWERLSKLDKDSDGKVSGQEMMAARNKGGDAPGKGKADGKSKADGKGKPGGPPRGEPGEMFKRADKNGDKKLTEDEVPAEIWARLSKLDTDEDNAVSAEEAKAGGRPDGPPKGGPKGKPGEMFKRADKNEDGKISQDEVPAEIWERIGRFDTDEDGAVTQKEVAAGMASGMRPGGEGKGGGQKGTPTGGSDAVISKFDKNADDKLAKDEVPAEMWDKVRKADTDADGLVSKKELEEVYKMRKP